MGLIGARSEPDLRASWQPLDEGIEDAAAWCARVADAAKPRHGLWSFEVAPSFLHRGRFDAVRDVVSTRRQSVRHGWRVPGLAGGRLLAYFPDSDLVDGAAEVESGGFFDAHNTPPWDTWVAYAEDEHAADPSERGYLVAWVPAALVPVAQGGIDANPEECIRWLQDTDTALARALRKRGSLGPPAERAPAPPVPVQEAPRKTGWSLPFFRKHPRG